LKVVVTGPEHSGTGLVADIVRNLGVKCKHKAMPHVDHDGCEIWWYPEHYPADLYIVVYRNQELYEDLANARGRTDGNYRARRAKDYLRDFPEDLTYGVQYATLVKYPEETIRDIAEFLGVDYVPYPKEIYDADSKYMPV
jgi:hypothetical protein